MLPLTPDIVAAPDRFVLHLASATAICADFHLGFEATMGAAGTPMPDFTSAPLLAAWQRLLASNPERIIIAGDLFHCDAPDAITRDAAVSLLTSVPKAMRVIVVPGNHDPAPAALQAIFAGTGIEVAEFATAGDYHIYHGHELPPGVKGRSRPPLILGHQHPAVVLADRVQSAKMLCFATISAKHFGPVILLPPFSAAPLGTNLLSARHWIIDLPLPELAAIRIAGIVRDQVLDFGPLSGLMQS